MKIAVTGAAGFIGSHLVDRLLADGHEVVGVDNLATGSRANLAHLGGNPRFRLVEADVCEPLEHPELAGPLEGIYHLASPASPAHYMRLPLETLRAGSEGTRSALELARAKGARLLLASSSEVYGDPEVHPQREDYRGCVNPVGPRSVYDEAKRYAEALASAYARELGEIGPAAAVAVPKLTELLGDRDQTTREAAAEALGMIGPAAARAAPALREALKDEGRELYRYGVRIPAAEALWRITGRTDEAIPLLVEAARSGDHTVARALRALGSMGPAGADAVAALVDLLEQEYGLWMSEEIAKSLGRIGPAAQDAVPALEKGLDTYSVTIRVASAEALWRITGNAQTSLPVLIRIARHKVWDQWRPWRRRAVEVIGDIGAAAKDALPALEQLLEDEDPDIRRAAAEAVRKIAGREGAP